MKKKKKGKLIIGIICLLLLIIGTSYAVWILQFTQNNKNTLVTGCFSFSLTNEQNNINLLNAHPIKDEEGKNLTPYSFTITNTCDLLLSYTVNLEILKNSTMPIKYIKNMFNTEEIKTLDKYSSTSTTISDATDSKVLATGILGNNDSVDFKLRLWMDENVTMENKDAMNKIFLSKIVVTASVTNYSPVKQGYTKLNEAILANEYQTSPEIAKERINSKQAVDFSQTAPKLTWEEKKNNTPIIRVHSLASAQLLEIGEVTENEVKPLLFKNYEFDENSGTYTLSNGVLMDPTTLKDSDPTDYYLCDFSVRRNTEGKLTVTNTGHCAKMYKIISATKQEGQEILGGENTLITSYSMTAYEYSQTQLESDKSDRGLYKMQDDFGDSYYYRGNVNNNYVKFGNFYWKITRINGDGSVRLIYLGTKPNANNTEISIGMSTFNSNLNYPYLVGYMYGNNITNLYTDNYKNEVDSTVKKVIDNWYSENILNTNLENHLADSGFCNDRSIATGDGVSIVANTIFKGSTRNSNFTPILKCNNIEQDLFTTVNSTVGNKALTYPIGLLTNDEAMIAGLKNIAINSLNFLYTGTEFWTMTPGAFSASTGIAGIRRVYYNGGLYNGAVTNNQHVRPVINLKNDTEIEGGAGTVNEPFVIKIN